MIVRSSSVVLPAPGELIRLMAVSPRLASQIRLWSASWIILGQHRLLKRDGVGAVMAGAMVVVVL
jgi:hypothetical protein